MRYNNLKDFFTAIAEAIRSKTKSNEPIIADRFPSEIENIKTGASYINHTVTELPDYAFYNCEELQDVHCYNVTKVGASAFEGCINLNTVTLYDVTEVGNDAFKNCGEAVDGTTIYIKTDYIEHNQESWNPGNITVLEPKVVYTWVLTEGTVTATLYDGTGTGRDLLLVLSGTGDITSREWRGYEDNISHVIIQDGITGIGSYTFYGHENLVSVAIPDSVTSIGEAAFSFCPNLIDITLPPNITSIAERTFSESGITNIVIPYGVHYIGQYAFIGCNSLRSVTIPNSVTNIDMGAFNNCSNLAQVHITDIAAWCNTSFYAPTANPLYYAKNLYINGELATSLSIPDTVTSIGDHAFTACNSLASIEIPDSVASIGFGAFSGCISLTSINIPDSVTAISGSVFNGCYGLCDVTIPDNVTTIGSCAFQNCTSLTSITIPASVVSSDTSAFKNCSNLTSVYITDLAAWCNISFGNIYANPLYSAKNLYINGELAQAITIPDSVTIINAHVFQNCSSLTSVTVNGNTTSILNYAFADCKNLTSVSISNGVTTIKQGAFARCSSLANVVLGAGITEIGAQVFSYCTDLASICIPNGVDRIIGEAFLGCSGLSTVTLPDSISVIGQNAFKLAGITQINYPGTVSQWLSLTKFTGWDNGTPDYTIYCTDGSIAKDGTVTYANT